MKLYEEFNDEAKKFLNKAMDIYSTIKDLETTKADDIRLEKTSYSLTKLDKKILSLYIASFIVDGNLKDVLSEYEDIKIEDLFSFINLKIEDIKKIDDKEYSKFYDENFKIALMTILGQKIMGYNFSEITPEVVFYLLGQIDRKASSILDCLSKACNLKCRWWTEHPSYNAVFAYALMKGTLQKNKFVRNSSQRSFVSLREKNKEENILNSNETEDKDLTSKKNEQVISLDNEQIWKVLDDIQKKFIAQELAAEYLFYNIVNNQQLALMDDIADGERSIIFLDGPTGTGKTAITREITDRLGIPFIATSVTNYSSTGYAGDNITDILKLLYKKSNEDLKKAERGIIVLDEFDKIAYSNNDGLKMKKAVQQQLLDFLGGGKYSITISDGMFGGEEIQFDTSKLTFVCLGALTELRSVKNNKKLSIGFALQNEIEKSDTYDITPQDLIDIGLERELVGRFNTYLHTEEYSKDDLLKILKESSISPLIGFEKWITSKGKKLQMDDDVYDLIATAAYDLNTGARGLQTIVNNIRTPFIKAVFNFMTDANIRNMPH